MKRDDPRFTISYATGEDRPAHVEIARFADGGATFRIPGLRPVVSFTPALGLCIVGIVAIALVSILLRANHLGGRAVGPLACGGVGILAVSAIRQLLTPTHETRKDRPPIDVVALSSRTVYVDVADLEGGVNGEWPREKLIGIEQVFPRRRHAMSPICLVLKIDGRRPIPFAGELQHKEMMDLLDALLDTMRRTAPAGSPEPP